MRLVTDTEMLEEVCEAKQEFWTGSAADLAHARAEAAAAATPEPEPASG